MVTGQLGLALLLGKHERLLPMTFFNHSSTHQTTLSSDPQALIRHAFSPKCSLSEAYRKLAIKSALIHSTYSNFLFGYPVLSCIRSPLPFCHSCTRNEDVRRDIHGRSDMHDVEEEHIGGNGSWSHSSESEVQDLICAELCTSDCACEGSGFSADGVSFQLQLSPNSDCTVKKSPSEKRPFLRSLYEDKRSYTVSLFIKSDLNANQGFKFGDKHFCKAEFAQGTFLVSCGALLGLRGSEHRDMDRGRASPHGDAGMNMRWADYVRSGLKAHTAADQNVPQTGIVSNLKVGNKYTRLLSPGATVTAIMISALGRTQELMSNAQSSAQEATTREIIVLSQAAEAEARAADAEWWAMDAESRAIQYERRANDAEVVAKAARSEQNILEQRARRLQELAGSAQIQAKLDQESLFRAQKERNEEHRRRCDAEAIAMNLERAAQSEIEARCYAEAQVNANRADLQKLYEVEMRALNAEEKAKKYHKEARETREQMAEYSKALQKLDAEVARANEVANTCLKAQSEAEMRADIYLRSLRDAQILTEKAEEEVEKLRETLDSAKEHLLKAKNRNKYYKKAREDAEDQRREIEMELNKYATALDKANMRTSKAEAKAEEYRNAVEEAQKEAYTAKEKAKNHKAAQQAAMNRLEEIEKELSWHVEALERTRVHGQIAEAFVAGHVDEVEERNEAMLSGKTRKSRS